MPNKVLKKKKKKKKELTRGFHKNKTNLIPHLRLAKFKFTLQKYIGVKSSSTFFLKRYNSSGVNFTQYPDK